LPVTRRSERLSRRFLAPKSKRRVTTLAPCHCGRTSSPGWEILRQHPVETLQVGVRVRSISSQRSACSTQASSVLARRQGFACRCVKDVTPIPVEDLVKYPPVYRPCASQSVGFVPVRWRQIRSRADAAGRYREISGKARPAGGGRNAPQCRARREGPRATR